jgi:GH3 auxin-responsive promoter
MTAFGVLQNLASRPLVRRVVDRVMGRYAVRRTAQLDDRSAVQAQQRTLLRLVRYAQHTRFGREHGFERIRNVADYQRRVPLRDYEAFWLNYWRDAFPYVQGVTWPDAIPYFALSSGTTSGTTKYIPISRQMLASNQRAALTSLALFLNAYPRVPLFMGRLFFLGGSTALDELGTRSAERGAHPSSVPHSALRVPRSIKAGDLSGITAVEASPLLRPYTFPPTDLALERDWEKKMRQLAERGSRLPITMLSGVPSWLLVLFDRLKQITGRERITDIWPMLRLVIRGGTKFEPYRALFQKEIGDSGVHFLETYPASEGFIATEDPRYEQLRLLPDHHLFFEFVPVEELGSANPRRHTLANLELGVQYAIVLTTCAGLWSYVLGDTICFESRQPPLLRFTGRTRYFLSAFGEHLISEEIEKAVAIAATATKTAVVDFHVGPQFPETPSVPGRHRYLVEFAQAPRNVEPFARELDKALARLNEDYAAHRQGDLTMLAPEVRVVYRGGFTEWMRAQGKLGGQHKVPRMDNSGRITSEMSQFFS